MKCERCQNHAATQAIRVEQEGKAHDLFVCDECARTAKRPNGSPLSLADILFSLGTPDPATIERALHDMAASVADRPQRTPACPVCGMTRDALREHRRFGCPECYKAFEDEVKSMLRELQYGDRHVGRVPRQTALRQRLDALHQELHQSIAAQRYEEAAALRDQIRQIEAEAEHPPTEEKPPSPTEPDHGEA